MQIKLDIRGDQQLKKFLAKFPTETKKGIRQSTRAATKEVILPRAKSDIPIGETGDLQRSLTVRVAKGAKQRRLPRHIIGHAVVTDHRKFPDQYYATFIEWGTEHFDAFSTLREAVHTTAISSTRVFKNSMRRNIAAAVRKMRWKARKQRDKDYFENTPVAQQGADRFS